MRWDLERYVKIYVRDTPEFLAMSWQARCLLHEIVRKVDAAGILKVGELGLGGIALAIRAPVDEIEGPVQELLGRKRLVWVEEAGHFLVPNHEDAQATPQSALARKRRERELASASLLGAPGGGPPSRVVAPSRDFESRDVTSDGVSSGHVGEADVTPAALMSRSEREIERRDREKR